MDYDLQKKQIAKRAIDYIKPGMMVGLGSGTTASFFIKELAAQTDLIQEIQCVPSSIEIEKLALQLNLPCIDFSEFRESTIDITVDGVDAYDDEYNMIKGGGGCLLREKRLHLQSKKSLILADSSKKVDHLETLGFIPIDIIPSAFNYIVNDLEYILSNTKSYSLRLDKEGFPFITDDGCNVLDLKLKSIKDLHQLNKQLKSLCGIVETGLFLDMNPEIIAY